jgi:hypothetical protein
MIPIHASAIMEMCRGMHGGRMVSGVQSQVLCSDNVVNGMGD